MAKAKPKAKPRAQVKSKAPAKPAAALAPPPKRYPLFPLYCAAAFYIPFMLVFIGYVLFGVFPFGERSVLTLDLNGQYVYYFENIRNAFWSGDNLLYSWARNLSGGYQGVIGYYLASPFTFIVILMPRTMIIEALGLMQMCKVGACGLTFCIYAHKAKGVKPLASVIFGVMYAMMSYVAIQLIDPMWLDGPIFLPLIILGVEYLVDDGRKVNYIIPLAIMFVANFYIGFMVAIFVAVYFVFYLFFGSKRKFKETKDYLIVMGRMILATGVVLMCSYIMIMPIYNALALGKFDFSEPDYSFKLMFNPLELIATLMPNQYYSVNVDEGTRMYGRPEIYSGVLTLVMVPLYYLNSRIKINRKIGYSLVLFVMFFSMWIKPLNMMWHGGQDPNWLPYRYSFIVSFVLIAMAAEVFTNIEGYKLNILQPTGVFCGISVITFLFAFFMDNFEYNESKYKYVAKLPYSTTETINGKSVEHLWLGTLAFGLGLAAIYLILVYLYSHFRDKQNKRTVTILMALLVIFEGGYNFYDTILKIDKEVYYSSRPSYTTIMDAPTMAAGLEKYDDGFYRAEKTFFRNVNDNQAYGLKGISHSSSVMNARILKFIETLGYTTKSYETRYDGNTPLADSLLGIKYVMDDPATRNETYNKKSLLSPYYKEVYTQEFRVEGGDSIKNMSMKERLKRQFGDQGMGITRTLHVYENPDALPIGFMASQDILRLSYLGNDDPFNSMNNFLSSMTGNTTDYKLLNPVQYFYRIAQYPEVELCECFESDYGGQHCYNANAGAVDPTVRIHFTTADTTDNLYMFLKSDNPKKCNLWVSDKKNPETGQFEDFKGYGSYFEDYDYSIVNLGSYPPNTELEIRLTILQTAEKSGANEYIMVKDFQFYHFDYDTFHKDISALKESPWELDLSKVKSNYLVGEVDAHEGEVFYTSIPYEPGWTIKVDGKKVDEAFYLNPENNVMVNDPAKTTGSVVILNALIGVRLTPGHHTVEMRYTPPGFTMGVFLLILGIAAVIVFYLYDRKNNEVYKLRRDFKANPDKYKKPEDEPAAESAEKKPKSEEPEEEKPEPSEEQPDDGETAVLTAEDLENVDINAINDSDSKKKNKKKKKK